MIESVQERQRGAYDFGAFYDNLCALQDSCPVPAVKAHLHEGVIDLNGDRIRAADWDPIFNALSINKNLRFIGVRSYFQLKISENTSERRAAHLKSKIPVIRSKDMTVRLCRAVRDSLFVSESLRCIELQGLPLREKDLSFLVKGLAKNNTLKHLSLEYCRIADFGVQIVCHALKLCGNVNTLNLTGCSLSYKGMKAIAELIQFQAMSRHNEAWKESLRYRRPNLDSMSGLRRITLNCNPLIDNEGAASLAEAVKDDMWVKAIDLQQCGVGNVGAKAFLNVLKYNATLSVLDLRQNPLIDRDILRAVTEQVLVNSDGKDTDYKWLRADDPHPNGTGLDALTPRSSTQRGIRAGAVAKRPPFRPSGPVVQTRPLFDGLGGSRSARGKADGGEEEVKTGRGLPWRTAARATRYRGYPPDHVPGKTHLEEQSVATTNELSSVHTARTDEDVESAMTEPTESVVSPLVREFEESPPTATTLKDLRIQVMHLRRQLNEEMRGRRRAEEKMMELMLEKQRMQKELDRSRNLGDSHLHSSMLPGSAGGAGLNDKLLRNIEQSFQQFHSFLDLLRDAGLGRVVTAAGMDQLPRTVPGSTNGGDVGVAPAAAMVHRDLVIGGSDDLEVPLDPVEQSYLSAAHARSEADRMYLRLKEATSRNGTDVSHLMPPMSVLPPNFTNQPQPARSDPVAKEEERQEDEEEYYDEEEEEEEEEEEAVVEILPEISHAGGGDSKKEVDPLVGNGDSQNANINPNSTLFEVEEVEEEKKREYWDLKDNLRPRSPLSTSSPTRPPRRLRSASEENVVSEIYNSDTFETSGDEKTGGDRTLLDSSRDNEF